MNPIGTSKVYFWISVILPLLLLAGTAAWVALTWDAIPEVIPNHFNLAGQPDGWGERGTIWINLGMGLMLYVLLLVTSFFPNSWRVRGLGRRADPNVALPATGGLLADYRLTIPSMMIFVSLWGILGIPGPGWIVSAAMFVLILLPLARFLVRVYVIRR